MRKSILSKGIIMLRRIALLLTLSCTVSFADGPSPVSPSLANEAKATIDRGVNWLVAKQAADGTWSSPDFPA